MKCTHAFRFLSYSDCRSFAFFRCCKCGKDKTNRVSK